MSALTNKNRRCEKTWKKTIMLEETMNVLKKGGKIDTIENGDIKLPTFDAFQEAKAALLNMVSQVGDLAEQCYETRKCVDNIHDTWTLATRKRHRYEQLLEVIFSLTNQKTEDANTKALGRRVLIMGMRLLESLLLNLKNQETKLLAKHCGMPVHEWNLVADQQKSLLENKFKQQRELAETVTLRERKLKDMIAELDQLDVTITTKTIEVKNALEERHSKVMKAQAYKGAEKSSRDLQNYIENERECIEKLNKDCDDAEKRMEHFRNTHHDPVVSKEDLDGAEKRLNDLSNKVVELKEEIPALQTVKKNFPQLDSDLMKHILLEEEKHLQLKSHHQHITLELNSTKENMLAAIRQRDEYSLKLRTLKDNWARMNGEREEVYTRDAPSL